MGPTLILQIAMPKFHQPVEHHFIFAILSQENRHATLYNTIRCFILLSCFTTVQRVES